MKVVFTQDYTVAIDGINIVNFENGKEYDLPEAKALLYIERGVCESKKEIAHETKVIEPVVETAVKKPSLTKKAK